VSADLARRLDAFEKRLTALEKATAIYNQSYDDGLIESIDGEMKIFPDPNNARGFMVKSAVTGQPVGYAGTLEQARIVARRIISLGKAHI
jgi:hypothetical protein